MVQHAVDPLTGAARDDVLMSDQDIRAAGLQSGQRIRLVGSDGSFTGRVRLAPIKPGNLEVHWPEGNVLLSGAAIDPRSKEPDYNATVTIELLQDE
jgi:anaerobic selenocysteine-containing dehydrogenase